MSVDRTRTRYEVLLARFRMMIAADGLNAELAKETDAELLARIKADTHEGKINAMEELTSLVPEGYWRARGL
jgi:hypothetical protein